MMNFPTNEKVKIKIERIVEYNQILAAALAAGTNNNNNTV
jgi:hypothetical protein